MAASARHTPVTASISSIHFSGKGILTGVHRSIPSSLAECPDWSWSLGIRRRNSTVLEPIILILLLRRSLSRLINKSLQQLPKRRDSNEKPPKHDCEMKSDTGEIIPSFRVFRKVEMGSVPLETPTSMNDCGV